MILKWNHCPFQGRTNLEHTKRKTNSQEYNIRRSLYIFGSANTIHETFNCKQQKNNRDPEAIVFGKHFSVVIKRMKGMKLNVWV